MNLHGKNNNTSRPKLIKTKTHSLCTFDRSGLSAVVLAGRKYAHQSGFESTKHIRNSSDTTNKKSHMKMTKRDSLKFSKTGPAIDATNNNTINSPSFISTTEDTISPMHDMLLISHNSEEYSEEYNNYNIEYQKENNYVGISEDK
eukprot:779769_1